MDLIASGLAASARTRAAEMTAFDALALAAGGGNNFATANSIPLTGITIPTAADGTMAGVDATLAAHAMPGFAVAEGVPSGGYGYVPDGANIAAGTIGGITLGAIPGIELVNSRWRWWFAYASFASGAGSFKPEVRQSASPFATVATEALINTNTGAEGYHLASLDVAANAAPNGMELRWARPGGTAVTGPALLYFARGENRDAEAGISVSTLYGIGGQSLYDMAYQLQNTGDQFLTNYFAEVRRLQLSHGLKPIVVVYVNSGLNDQNEAGAPSLGWRANAAGASAAAYLDNLDAIATRIGAIWDLNGWARDELFWFIMPSHPIPSDDVLQSYRAVAAGWAAKRQADRRVARTTFLDLTTVTSSAEILALNGYQSGNTDFNHLVVPTMYDTIVQRVVNLIPALS